jgi:hypothetical protein
MSKENTDAKITVINDIAGVGSRKGRYADSPTATTPNEINPIYVFIS